MGEGLRVRRHIYRYIYIYICVEREGPMHKAATTPMTRREHSSFPRVCGWVVVGGWLFRLASRCTLDGRQNSSGLDQLRMNERRGDEVCVIENTEQCFGQLPARLGGRREEGGEGGGRCCTRVIEWEESSKRNRKSTGNWIRCYRAWERGVSEGRRTKRKNETIQAPQGNLSAGRIQ